MVGSGTSWGLVVPVKQLHLAKTRLRPYGDAARSALALAFAQDVVAAALRSRGVGTVLVVTNDAHAARTLADLGAEVTADMPGAGHNAALAHGERLLRARPGAAGVACLSADLPALTPEALAAALAAVPAGVRAFVPDAGGSGTTLLAAGPGALLRPAYGPGSCGRHRASGARDLPADAVLRRDVDTPDDLAEALLLGVGPATASTLKALS